MRKILLTIVHFFILCACFILCIPLNAEVRTGKVTMPCMKTSGYPTTFEYPADPKAQLSFQLEGIKIEGQEQLIEYDVGRLSKEVKDLGLPRSEFRARAKALQEKGELLPTDVNIIVNTYCTGSGRDSEKITIFHPKESRGCAKGEGLSVELHDPACYKEGSTYKAGIFTLTVVRDDDEKEAEKAVQKVADANGEKDPGISSEESRASSSERSGSSTPPKNEGATTPDNETNTKQKRTQQEQQRLVKETLETPLLGNRVQRGGESGGNGCPCCVM